MRTFTSLFLLLILTVATFAQRGGRPNSKGVMGPGQVMRETMGQGLLQSERATLRSMYGNWSADEQRVMLKRWGLCMRNVHKPAVNMGEKKAFANHMMSGLNPGEQVTMKKALSKMTPKETSIFFKAAKNCCAYGMQHPH